MDILERRKVHMDMEYSLISIDVIEGGSMGGLSLLIGRLEQPLGIAVHNSFLQTLGVAVSTL